MSVSSCSSFTVLRISSHFSKISSIVFSNDSFLLYPWVQWFAGKFLFSGITANLFVNLSIVHSLPYSIITQVVRRINENFNRLIRLYSGTYLLAKWFGVNLKSYWNPPENDLARGYINISTSKICLFYGKSGIKTQNMHNLSKSFPQVIHKTLITFQNVENVDNLWIKFVSSLLYIPCE